MTPIRSRVAASIAILSILVVGAHALSTARPSRAEPTAGLASWRDVASKKALLEFVAKVTKEGGPDYVAPADRIAVFDNDGTLWVEHPMYTQLFFALDRVKALAPEHPDWKEREPFKSVLSGDLKAALAGGEKAMVEIVGATHAGMSTSDFESIVSKWFATAKHPKFDRPFNTCIYQPMVEVLTYLRDAGFETWIVSGGGVEFMRPITLKAYGIPPEQVVGSRGKLNYEVKNGVPMLMKLPEIDFVDDGPGKPVGIERAIGKRPILAFGNSDGDFQMLEWTTAGKGARLGLLVHHTDAEREYAYDRDTHVGRLDKALDAAPSKGWIVVDMAKDWSRIFP